VRNCKLLTLVMVASTVLAGCHLFDDRQPPIQRWGGLFSDLRYQWDGEPGIDVLNGAAVPVRAYIESRWLARAAGNLDYAYPGFTQAVPPDPPDAGWGLTAEGQSLTEQSAGRQREIPHPFSEPLRRHCHRYGVRLRLFGAHQVEDSKEDDKFESVARRSGWQPKGIFVERVTLAALTDESSPLPPQAGPSPAPSDDVFGDWKITGYLFSTSQPGFKSQWPASRPTSRNALTRPPIHLSGAHS
jgi:hypothetical protein